MARIVRPDRIPSAQVGLRDFGKYHEENILDNVVLVYTKYTICYMGSKGERLAQKTEGRGMRTSTHSMALEKGIMYINFLKDYVNNTSPSKVQSI